MPSLPRRPWVPAALGALALAFLWHFAAPGPTEHRPVNPRAAALIDQLVEVADEGPGTHSTAWARGFLAVDEEPQFVGGILGSRRPVVHPALWDLVRMGVDALPDLLDHLTDARTTRLTVGNLANWHSDEYAPRYRDPQRQPPGVNRHRSLDAVPKTVEAYTVRVGDLCYVAVGQIVNWDLAALRYQPTACLVVNSPVATPALAAAARQDWSGLTAHEHQQSLARDALDKKPGATEAALRRLYFYYPRVAESLALRLLARPWYDDGKVWEFALRRLVLEKDPARWRGLIADFAAENGPAAAEVIPFRLHWFFWREGNKPDEDFLAAKAVAAQILAVLYPGYDPSDPPFINAADTGEQRDLIRGLAGIRSVKLDEAVAGVIRSLGQLRYEGPARVAIDDVALACMDRLIGKGMDKEFAAYCDRRIKELEGRKRQVAEDQRLKSLREQLWRFRQGGGQD